ncbi:37s ribosomal protein mitochondrial protein [Pyrenophora teres f. teres]|uniref:37s ribosomal protein mitochondrial protein n=1 Tax=Pyrenophora teres f. teres TaxID=97479 RepID=A0A6S6V554_9PLEO|nr:37s ribosomal protein mitochondrial protein [Pyrenophora teres f. teres]
MVPKPQGSAVHSATHRPLPPLPKLRVRRPNKPEMNPCLGAMSSVLGSTLSRLRGQAMLGKHMTGTCADMSITGCWASSGYSVQGCALLEQKLRQCMDAPRNPNQKKNNINFHLSRMYPKIVGPHKRN